jgi:hypothetical protein
MNRNVKSQSVKKLKERVKNNVMDNSRSSGNSMATRRGHIIHIGRVYTHSAGNRDYCSFGKSNYGSQDRLEITHGPHNDLMGGLKWNK